MPLFVIRLGIEIWSKIALAVVLVAVLIFFAVYNGMNDVNRSASLSPVPASANRRGDTGPRLSAAVRPEHSQRGADHGFDFFIMAFVLLLFFCAEAVEQRLLRWRYRSGVKSI